MTTVVRVCTALTIVGTLSACAAGGGAKPATTPTARAGPDTTKKDVPWKPWAEVTKDARQLTGLFTAYVTGENVYLELKPGEYDRDCLRVTQLSRGRGGFGFDGGTDMRSDLSRF